MSNNKKRNNDSDNHNDNDTNSNSNKKRKDDDHDDLIGDMMNSCNDNDNSALQENQKTEKCERILFSKICEKLQLMENARKSKKVFNLFILIYLLFNHY